MAVKASVTITISKYRDTDSITRYYKLQASTAAAPAVPTTLTPSGWSTSEPTYTSGSTNTLYYTDCVVFSDGTFQYTDDGNGKAVKSSSYEAAKEAYNKAQAAQNTANTAQQNLNNLEIDAGNLWFNGQKPKPDNTQWINDVIVSYEDLPQDINAKFKLRNDAYSKYYVPFDKNRKYEISCWFKSIESVSDSTTNYYPSIVPIDADGNQMNYDMFKNNPYSIPTITTLLEDLNSGDTIIHAEDLSGWNTSSASYGYHIGFFNYKSSKGYEYNDYTRNRIKLFNENDDKSQYVNKTNNTITLKTAYTGTTIPAGTVIAQLFAGSTYIYPYGGLSYKQTKNWTFKSKVFSYTFDNRLNEAKYICLLTTTGGHKVWYCLPCLKDVTEEQKILKTVKQVDVEYYLSTSSTECTGGSWSTTAPAWVDEKYMWSRQKVTYVDDTTATRNQTCIAGAKGSIGKSTIYFGVRSWTQSTIDSVCAIGYTSIWSQPSPGIAVKKDDIIMLAVTNTTTNKNGQLYIQVTADTAATSGPPGKVISYIQDGATGTGIDSITEEYYLSTSKTTQTGGSWVTTPPTWKSGKYIWTRSKIIYKNPASTVYTTPLCSSEWEAVNEINIGTRNLFREVNYENYTFGAKNLHMSRGSKSEYNRNTGEFYYIGESSGGEAIKGKYFVDISSFSELTVNIEFERLTEDTASVQPIIKFYNDQEEVITGSGTMDGWIWNIYYQGWYYGASIFPKKISIPTGATKCKFSLASNLENSQRRCRVNIVAGNKIGDWSPAPEDKTYIGTKNLFRNTNKEYNSSGSTYSYGYWYFANDILNHGVKIEPGDYVLSYDWKVVWADENNKKTHYMSVGLGNSPGAYSRDISIYDVRNLLDYDRTNLLNYKDIDKTSGHDDVLISISAADIDNGQYPYFAIRPVRSNDNTAVNGIWTFTNFKLVKGNSASSDWTPAPEDIDANINKVQENLDNLEIGGRNLIRNSSFKFDLNDWKIGNSGQYQYELVDGYNDAKALKIVKGDATSNIAFYQFLNVIIKANTMLTASMKVKTISGNADNLYMRFASTFSMPRKSKKVLDNGWVLYTYQGIPTSDINTESISFGPNGAAGEFIFDDLKLEYGNKPTDWTAAPEDTDTEIQLINTVLNGETGINARLTSAETTIDSIRGKIVNQVIDANGKVITTQTSNGLSINLSGITNDVSQLLSDMTTKEDSQDAQAARQLLQDQLSKLQNNTAFIRCYQELEKYIEDNVTKTRMVPIIELGSNTSPFHLKINNEGIYFVEGYPTFVLTTSEPSDWNTNYNDYYTLSEDDIYVQVQTLVAPTWEANKYYEKDTVNENIIAFANGKAFYNLKTVVQKEIKLGSTYDKDTQDFVGASWSWVSRENGNLGLVYSTGQTNS